MKASEQSDLLILGRTIVPGEPAWIVHDLIDFVLPEAGYPSRIWVNPDAKRSTYWWIPKEIEFSPYFTLTSIMHETAHHLVAYRYGLNVGNVWFPHGPRFVKVYDILALAAHAKGYYNPLTG